MFDLIKEISKRRKNRKMTFEDLADEWLRYKRNKIKESTYFNYMLIIENHLKPNLKKINFNKTIDYNEFVNELLKKLEPKTVKDIIMVLKGIFKYYEEEYHELNIKRCTMPKSQKKMIKILSEREKEKLEKYCLDNPTLKSLGIILCLNTGMRVGEICNLKWKNIDLDRREIYINKIIERVYDKKKGKTKLIELDPKSNDSIRSIPISNKLYDILKPLKNKYKGEEFFLSGREKCIEPRNYQEKFKYILKKAQINKSYKFHVLRHTFATNCIDAGMDIKSLSEILGHSDVKITLNIYVHSSNKTKRRYLEKI